MRSDFQSNRRRAAGFTLVELLLVLLIMATFATLVTPSVAQALRANDIDAAGEKVRDTLQFAYASALSRRQPVMVNVDHARRRCWVTLRPLSLPWLEAQEKPVERTLAAMTWPESMQLGISRSQAAAAGAGASAAFETITFRSNGRTDDLVIELSGQKQEQRFIEVVGATGEVRLREAASP